MSDIVDQVKPTAFLICPIGSEGSVTRQHADYLMECIVLPAVRGLYKVDRADRMPTFGRIDDNVLRKLISSDLVLVDLTDQNPNVFFEFGIRFAFANLPFICVVKKNQIDGLPFDVKPLSVVALPRDLDHYGNDAMAHKQDERRAVNELKALAETLLSDPNQFRSPMRDQAQTVAELAGEGADKGVLSAVLEKVVNIEGSLAQLMRLGPKTMEYAKVASREEDTLERGLRLYRERRYDAAVEVLERVVAKQPEHVGATLALGEALLGSGDRARALSTLRRAVELNPELESIQRLLTLIEQAGGDGGAKETRD